MTTAIANVSKLTSRVLRVLGCNPGPMTLQGTNTYIIGTGNRRILLDTGEPNIPQYISNLKTVLKNNEIAVEHVIITHWHNDHIGGLPEVMELALPDCKVWKFRRNDVQDSTTAPEPVYKSVKLNTLQDGQVFETEGATLRVLYTPGHTTDHAALYLKEENAVFSGDCILGEGTTVFEDLHSFLDSLRLIQSMQPTLIYPGHGPVVEDPSEKIAFYIQHRLQRESDIIRALKNSNNNPVTSLDIVADLYKDYPENIQKAAQYVVEQHLKKLVKDGLVIQNGDKWKLNVKHNL